MRVRIDRSSTVPSGCVIERHFRQAGVLTFAFNSDDITALAACELGDAMTVQITSWEDRATSRRAWYPVTMFVRRASGMPYGGVLWVHEESGVLRYWFDRSAITREGAAAFERTLTRSQVGWVQAGNACVLRAIAG